MQNLNAFKVVALSITKMNHYFRWFGLELLHNAYENEIIEYNGLKKTAGGCNSGHQKSTWISHYWSETERENNMYSVDLIPSAMYRRRLAQ